MSYTRSRSSTRYLTGNSSLTSPGGSPSSQRYSTLLTLTESRSGRSMPNYGTIIASGGNATTDYDALYIKMNSASASSARVSWADGTALTYGGNRFLDLYATPSLSLALRAEEEAAHNGASSTRSGFSGGTFLGELRETMQMLKQPALALRKLTDETYKKRVYRREWFVRSPSRQRYRDSLKALSDLHLEFQFGWKPLAADIQSAYDAATRMGNSPKRIQFRGSGRDVRQDAEKRVANYNVGDTNTPLGVYLAATHQAGCSLKGVCSLKLGFGMPAFQQGTTIPDFVPTLWNLMPWSFLVDYFSNVGQCLETRAFAQLVSLSWASQSTFVETTSQVRNSFYKTYDTGQRISPGGPSGGFTAVLVSRRRVGSYPVPSMQASKALTSARGLNIAALANGKLQDVLWKKEAPSSIKRYFK